MQTDKNKKIGLAVMILGVLGFSFFFWYFKLDGAKIEYRNLEYVIKMLFTYSFIPAGLGFGLYFAHSKKFALQLGLGLEILIIIGYIIGFLIH